MDSVKSHLSLSMGGLWTPGAEPRGRPFIAIVTRSVPPEPSKFFSEVVGLLKH